MSDTTPTSGNPTDPAPSTSASESGSQTWAGGGSGVADTGGANTSSTTQVQTVSGAPPHQVIDELLGVLRLEVTAPVVDAVWSWAGTHFGWARSAEAEIDKL